MLKSNFPDVVRRISRRVGLIFSKIPLPPNAWMVLALFLAIIGFFVLVYYKNMLLGFVIFFIAGFFDAVDGAVARATRSVTKIGGYLDGIIDRLVEGFLLIGLFLFGLPSFEIFGYQTPAYLWIALLLFFGTALVSYARAYAVQHGIIVDEKVLEKMPGVLERTERLFLIGSGMLLYYVNPVYTTYIIALAFLLSVITFLQRVFFVIRRG